MGLVSSSLDATLAVLDLERGKLSATVALHRKGVRTFGYSPAFSLVARWAECLGSADSPHRQHHMCSRNPAALHLNSD